MSFIPFIYRRNKLVSIGVRSSTLDYEEYSLTLNLENNESLTTKFINKTYVSKLILIINFYLLKN